MNAVVIGPEEKAALQRMKEFARAHPIPFQDVKAIENQVVKHPPAHYTRIPFGMQVGLTYELQGPMELWHVSVSVDIPGRLPAGDAIAFILSELFQIDELKIAAQGWFGCVFNLWIVERVKTYSIIEGPSIVCHRCGMRSYSAGDIENRYCGRCHRFHEA